MDQAEAEEPAMTIRRTGSRNKAHTKRETDRAMPADGGRRRRRQRKIVPPSAVERVDKCRKDGPLKAATTLLRRAARAEADAEGGPPADGGFVEG